MDPHAGEKAPPGARNQRRNRRRQIARWMRAEMKLAGRVVCAVHARVEG